MNIDKELDKAREEAWAAADSTTLLAVKSANSAYWSAYWSAYSVAYFAAKSAADSAATSAYWSASAAEKLKQVEMIKEALSGKELRD